MLKEESLKGIEKEKLIKKYPTNLNEVEKQMYDIAREAEEQYIASWRASSEEQEIANKEKEKALGKLFSLSSNRTKFGDEIYPANQLPYAVLGRVTTEAKKYSPEYKNLVRSNLFYDLEIVYRNSINKLEDIFQKAGDRWITRGNIGGQLIMSINDLLRGDENTINKAINFLNSEEQTENIQEEISFAESYRKLIQENRKEDEKIRKEYKNLLLESQILEQVENLRSRY